MIDLARDLSIAMLQPIRDSLNEVRRSHPNERLTGYALCTDDGLQTVFHASCSREQILANPDIPDMAWVPTEWPYGEGATHFDGVQKLVQAHYSEASARGEFPRHIADTFEAFVLALHRCREEGLFADDMLLLVVSTDPSPQLEAMACRAAKVLNAPHVFEQWRSAMGYPAPT